MSNKLVKPGKIRLTCSVNGSNSIDAVASHVFPAPSQHPTATPDEAQTITELGQYVETFIGNRFPEGLPPELYQIITDIVLDAFHDGARWAEEQAGQTRIITGF